MFPRDWAEKLFSKLTLVYGHRFSGLYSGMDMVEVMEEWREQLDGFERNPDAIRFALANLPEQPPTVLQFKAILLRAPLPEFKALPAPKADPERVKAELAKFKPNGPSDPKDWARRILARVEAGEKPSHVSVTFAKQALGLIPGGF